MSTLKTSLKKVSAVALLILGYYNNWSIDATLTPQPEIPKYQKMVQLQSSDGKIFTAAQQLLTSQSKTIQDMLEDIPESELPIPLVNIDGDTLEAILTCIKEPEDASAIIASLTGKRLFKFIEAIAYLDMPQIFKQLPALNWLLSQKTSEQVFNRAIQDIAISPDNKLIVSRASDGNIYIFNKQDGALKFLLKDAVKDVVDYVSVTMEITNDSKYLIHFTKPFTDLKIWDLATGNLKHTIHLEGQAYGMIGQSDGLLFIPLRDNGIKVFDSETGKCLHTIALQHPHIVDMAINKKASLLAISFLNEKTEIWNIKTMKLMYELGETRGDYVVISNDGSLIITKPGHVDTVLNLWDVHTGNYLRTIKDKRASTQAIAISNDGSFIAIGCDDGTVHLWDTLTGELLQTLQGHTTEILDIKINSHDSLMITRSSDGIMRLWDVKTKKCLYTIPVTTPLGLDSERLLFATDSSFIAVLPYKERDQVGIINLLNLDQVATLHAQEIYLITRIYDRTLEQGVSPAPLNLTSQEFIEEFNLIGLGHPLAIFNALPTTIQNALLPHVQRSISLTSSTPIKIKLTEHSMGGLSHQAFTATANLQGDVRQQTILLPVFTTPLRISFDEGPLYRGTLILEPAMHNSIVGIEYTPIGTTNQPSAVLTMKDGTQVTVGLEKLRH